MATILSFHRVRKRACSHKYSRNLHRWFAGHWMLRITFRSFAAIGAGFWPDSYLSQGAIRVVPPQVPQQLVPTNISEQIAGRINAMYQGIVSRPTLTTLIQTYNLYPYDRKRLPMEDVIESMRKDIKMSPLLGLGKAAVGKQNTGVAFTVSFSYSDRKNAEKICRELITRFIDESIRVRGSQSNATTEFFKDQVETSRKDLEDIAKRIAGFRAKYPTEIPEKEESLINRLNNFENTIQTINTTISRANQEKLQYESQLRTYKEQLNALVPVTPQAVAAAAVPKNDRIVELDKEIGKLESGLAFLRETYRDDYPEVQRQIGFLTTKKQQRDQLVAAEEAARAPAEAVPGRPTPVPAGIPVTKESKDLVAIINKYQAMIQAKDLEIEDMTRQISDIRKRIATVQAQIDSSPAIQAQFQQMIRDREAAQVRYDGLAVKMQSSSMATELENRKQGETLELLEEPNVPQDPYAPKRLPIILGAIAGGLVLGALFGGFREFKDTSLRNVKDVRAYTKLMVLGSIPLLEDEFVVRKRRRVALLAWSAAVVVGVLLMSGSMFYYFSGRA
jgi:uncharacterized protein involved in exopolysaccharide biosynthesis